MEILPIFHGMVPGERARQVDGQPGALSRFADDIDRCTDHTAAEGHGRETHCAVAIGLLRLFLRISKPMPLSSIRILMSFSSWVTVIKDPSGLRVLVNIGQRFLEDPKQTHLGLRIRDVVK